MRVLVGGFIGLFPTGGATWDYIQYPLGLKLLGHDVYYIEDTATYPVFQLSGDKWDDCTYGVEYLRKAMSEIGMKDRWAYRDIASGKTFGMSNSKLKKVCESADVFINVSSSTFWREEYLKIPSKIFIDTDPMFTQYQYHQKMEAGGADAQYTKEYMQAHDLYFTFGLNIGKPDCRIPQFEYNWLTTKKPICLSFWDQPFSRQSNYGFTSIMNWTERPDFEYDNDTWGQKNKEFRKFFDLPAAATEKPFEMIINRPKDAETARSMDTLTERGWHILSPDHLISDKENYKNFVQSSFGEFSVTKETYIKSNSGWFSGRSAVYLASGKPVLTQDTQWSKYIPAGEGVLAISDLETATEAVAEVTANYERHSNAAREIAREYFDSGKVLSDILSHVK